MTCLRDGCIAEARIKFCSDPCKTKFYNDKRPQTGRPNSSPKTQIDGDGRVCTTCFVWKPWDDFYRAPKTITGYHPNCRRCHIEKYDSPEKAHRRYLSKNGWTPEMVDAVLYLQEGKCANEGCSRPATQADHDHDTGEARAMLCQPCNVALGILEEDPEAIRGLARYAEQCQNVKAWAA